MKFFILSDHTAAQLVQAERAREAEYQARLFSYEQVIAQIRRRKEEANRALSQAWQESRIGGILRGLRGWIGSRLVPSPAAPVMAAPDRQETIWAAGREGEQIALQALASQLDDSWTVMAGYRNRRGEIDLVAVGPAGIVALEIKYLNGMIHCDGDLWYRDRYDKYGNLVEQNLPIVDRSGRSPSRQLNEAADALQIFLERRSIPKRTLRVVVLSHNMSQLGTMQNQTVDWVSTAGDLDLIAFCRDRCTPNSPTEITRVVALIQQDHAFSLRPRTPGNKPA